MNNNLDDVNKFDYKKILQQLVDELSELASSTITITEKDGTVRSYRTDELQEDFMKIADKYQDLIFLDNKLNKKNAINVSLRNILR